MVGMGYIADDKQKFFYNTTNSTGRGGFFIFCLSLPRFFSKKKSLMTDERLFPSQDSVSLQFEGIPLTCPIENGHPLIPVKVICHMIDVAYKNQYDWIKNDEILG